VKKEAPKAPAAPVGLGKGKPRAKKEKDSATTRRRSFDEKDDPSSSSSSGMVGSVSVPVIPTTAPDAIPLAPAPGGVPAPGPPRTGTTTTSTAGAATSEAAIEPATADLTKRDNWDSVSQMPYCHDCQMAFKSEGLLDRHIKYSSLHASTVKKKAAEQPQSVGTSPELLVRKAIEGEDYTVMYAGSKFFWRSQDNIEMSFFHHSRLTNTVELISFDPSKNQVMPRIYLDMKKLRLLIQPDLELAKQASELGAKTSKFTQAKVNEEGLIRRVMTTAVLARLHLLDPVSLTVSIAVNSDEAVARRSGRCVSYMPATGDIEDHNPLLPGVPSGLVPVQVTHRRNTTTEEITAKMADLEISKRELQMATQRAEKVVTHVQQFAKNMKAEFLAMSKMSKPRKRWVLAINRVLQINGVAKTMIVLEKLEAAKLLKEKGADRRAQLSVKHKALA